MNVAAQENKQKSDALIENEVKLVQIWSTLSISLFETI